MLQMLYKNNPLSNPCQVSSSASNSSSKACEGHKLSSIWEMFVSKGEALDFYEGMKLETPIIALSVIHQNYDYPQTKGVI